MHAMNASSLHLWLNFYSSLKCYHSYNCSLKTVPVAWTCTLQVYAKFLGFSGVLSVWGQIWRTWSCPWVIIQTPWSWCSLLTGAVLMALYFISLPGLSCSTDKVIPGLFLDLTAATSLWMLLQDPASGHHGMRGMQFIPWHFHPPAPITSLYTWFPHLLL